MVLSTTRSVGRAPGDNQGGEVRLFPSKNSFNLFGQLADSQNFSKGALLLGLLQRSVEVEGSSSILHGAIERLRENFHSGRTQSLRDAFRNLPREEQRALKKRFGSRLSSFISIASETDSKIFFKDLSRLACRAKKDGDTILAGMIFQALSAAPELNGLKVPEDVRNEARDHFAVMRGGGPLGLQLESQLDQFVKQVTHPSLLVGMGVGSLVASSVRLGLLSRMARLPVGSLLRNPTLSYLTASTAAFVPEVLSVYGAGHATEALINPNVDFGDFRNAGQEIKHLAGMLAFLKVGGALFRGIFNLGHGVNPLTGQIARANSFTKISLPLSHQLGMFSGLYSYNRLGHYLGVNEQMDSGAALTRSLATLVQFNVAGALANRIFGARYQNALRYLEGRTQEARIEMKGEQSGLFHFPAIGPEMVTAEGIKIPVHEGPLTQTRSHILAMASNGETGSAKPRNGHWGRTLFFNPRVGDPPVEPAEWVETYLKVDQWLEKAPEMTREEFLGYLLRVKWDAEIKGSQEILLSFILRGLQQQGVSCLKDFVVNDTLFTEIHALETAFQHWSQWDSHFRNLAEIPFNGRKLGWSRTQYALEYLRKSDGSRYLPQSVDDLIRGGLLILKHRETLGLPRPNEIPMEPAFSIAKYSKYSELVGRLEMSKRENGYLLLLRRRPEIQMEIGGEISIATMLSQLAEMGFLGFHDHPVSLTTLQYAYALDQIYSRWGEWGPHLANLASIPKNRSKKGWSRPAYVREYLRREDGEVYSESVVGTLVNMGVFLYHNHENVGLPTPSPVPLKPNPTKPYAVLATQLPKGIGVPAKLSRRGNAEKFFERLVRYRQSLGREVTFQDLIASLVERKGNGNGQLHSLRFYARGIDEVLHRWRDWRWHLKILSRLRITRGPATDGAPTRREYAEMHLRQPNGEPYAKSMISNVARWGPWVYGKRTDLGLKNPSTMPPPPDGKGRSSFPPSRQRGSQSSIPPHPEE